MSKILIIGATRGLGASLVKEYTSKEGNTVYATARSTVDPKDLPEHVKWLPNIDVSSKSVGKDLVDQLDKFGAGEGGNKAFDVVIVTAGYFATENFKDGPNWDDEVKMYTTSAISPPFIVHSLFNAKYLAKGSKVVLVSSESGSIALRHETEGGGNYAHHASKTALNMVGKLLSLDVKEYGIIISIVHPGFMRTEMTKGVGYDKYWDAGGAVHPDEAATSLAEWIDKELDFTKSGEYWAPRGPGDIGTAEPVLGKGLSTPLRLPW